MEYVVRWLFSNFKKVNSIVFTELKEPRKFYTGTIKSQTEKKKKKKKKRRGEKSQLTIVGSKVNPQKQYKWVVSWENNNWKWCECAIFLHWLTSFSALNDQTCSFNGNTAVKHIWVENLNNQIHLQLSWTSLV